MNKWKRSTYTPILKCIGMCGKKCNILECHVDFNTERVLLVKL